MDQLMNTKERQISHTLNAIPVDLYSYIVPTVLVMVN